MCLLTSVTYESPQIYGPIVVGCAGMKVPPSCSKLLSLPLLHVPTPQLSIYLYYIVVCQGKRASKPAQRSDLFKQDLWKPQEA